MGGQALYLLETLKLLRDRQWLVPPSAAPQAAPVRVRQRPVSPKSGQSLGIARQACWPPRRLFLAAAPGGTRLDQPLSPLVAADGTLAHGGPASRGARPGQRVRSCSPSCPQLPPRHATWPSAPRSVP